MYSYYEVMMAVQKDCGNLDLKKEFLYNDFRSSWYAYLRLLDVSFASSAECDKCGKVPKIVVCDATGMGFQKKFLTSGLCDSTLSKPYPRYSLVLLFLSLFFTSCPKRKFISLCFLHSKCEKHSIQPFKSMVYPYFKNRINFCSSSVIA